MVAYGDKIPHMFKEMMTIFILHMVSLWISHTGRNHVHGAIHWIVKGHYALQDLAQRGMSPAEIMDMY